MNPIKTLGLPGVAGLVLSAPVKAAAAGAKAS
nr:hypothetical protein [uncultured bacterium]